jgi:uncharacterized membrane protein
MDDPTGSHENDARPPPAKRAFHPWDPRRAAGRLVLSVAAGVVATLIAPTEHEWKLRAVIGWDVGALTMNLLAWSLIGRSDAKRTQRRAGAYDPGRTAVNVLALLSSIFSLFAATFVLRTARGFAPPEATVWTVLALSAVVLSWVLTHTAYTLRYAHLYYRRASVGGGGLEFPGGHAPSAIDFAYFAFTIGMCFQVSDVTISSSAIRRAVLLHALVSFVYNTTILALALNVAFALLG